MNGSQQSSISMEQLLRHQACPMTASVNLDPRDDMKADVAQWYAYFNKLPLAIRWGLVDKEIVDQILALAKRHNIYDEFKIGEVSRIVRENFFKPLNEQQLQERIKAKLGIDDKEIEKVVTEIKNLFIEVERVGKARVLEVTENIPIIPALKKFPLLRNQIITQNNIKLFETKEFVTPSVGNWIDDYIQRKGAQAHNNIQRSDYIFNSENGMKLDNEDRKKLGSLLESYDNDNSLDVNSESQEIMFSGGFEPDNKVRKVEIQEPAEIEQEIPGPPQPQVDVMPEKDAMLKDWRNQNLQSMNSSETAISDNESTQQSKSLDQNNQIDREKKLLPHERTQEIGWFGESTGIDEVKRQIPERQNENDQLAHPKDKKEAKYGHPRTITRNYREVENTTKKGSKHVINLKEVV